MSLTLVFPPLADPTQPYSSLPALAGFLRARGRQDVLLVDANIEFVRHVLTEEAMRAAGEGIRARLAVLDRSPAPHGSAATEYALLVRASLKAPMVSERIDAAVGALGQSRTFFDLERLERSKRLVSEAMEVLSAAWSPLELRFSNPSGAQLGTPGEISGWAKDPARNPYHCFFETHVLPRIERAAPAAVGISITYRSQVLAAVVLALLLRKRLPGVPVILGGHVVSAWYPGLESCPEVFDWCDYVVAYEGESALDGLLHALEGPGSLSEVPNIAYREGERVRKTLVTVEDLDRMPTPDYRGLPLDLYLAPQPVFLISTSRGCYWSRCAFCAVSPSMRTRYRVRHPDLVAQDISTLVKRHDARCVSFGDDCCAPSALDALASRLESRALRISWQCEVRFEKALTSRLLRKIREAGCKNLIFGLESYVPRVLERMEKGTHPKEIDRILKDCRRLGIAFNLQFFFGFPGETESEAEVTRAFAARQARGAATLSFGTFELQRGARVEQDPQAFGVDHVAREGRPLALKFDYTPAPRHAREMVSRLRQELCVRSPYLHAGLSINAHTLIFLHEAGVSAMARLYQAHRTGAEPHRPMSAPVRHRPLPRGDLNVGFFRHVPGDETDGVSEREGENGRRILVYAYGPDRTVAVSRLALWVLKAADGTRTIRDLTDELLRAAGPEGGARWISAEVRGIVDDLTQRGFLV